MNAETLIRAWKDPAFRASLSSEQRQALPENPSGKPMTELGDDELTDVTGGGSLIRPTPPILFTRGTGCVLTGTRGSAVDACPSAWGCTATIFTIQEHQTPVAF
jgi:mersacidin/lichenicidin family type 2 lantibiotic